MLGETGILIGEITGVAGVVSMLIGLRRWWVGRLKVPWLDKPLPPEEVRKIPPRRVHPEPINVEAANKVFLVGTDAASNAKVRYLVKELRVQGESCYIYDLVSRKRIRDFTANSGSIRWNNFFETVGHRIPYSAIPYENDEEWVKHGLQHVPRINVELEK